ncbi:hypothetical protein [Mycobacteroides salmoniphilum]|uniref:Uncharacterized protein n=1 Tax=Mycobacteroides salmoniphilum TaxID=404941 RepID=A0A4R8T078_9MYCO|nr:hypothetical protein [Mycobacteroides salmoniphilum]TEA09156.1 hypothetical protein CCUG60884_00325 [Mycobacteroides salmoniphilum]
MAVAEETFYRFDKMDTERLRACAVRVDTASKRLVEHLEKNRPVLESIIKQNRNMKLREACAAATALLRYRYPERTGDRWPVEEVLWAYRTVGTPEALELADYWSKTANFGKGT